MKVVDNKKKDKSLLKKIFIKLCRKIGYEIIAYFLYLKNKKQLKN